MTAPHVLRVAQALAAGDNTILAWVERHRVTRTQAYDAVRLLRRRDMAQASKSHAGVPSTYRLTQPIEQVMAALQKPADAAPFAGDRRWNHQALMEAWSMPVRLPDGEGIRFVTRG